MKNYKYLLLLFLSLVIVAGCNKKKKYETSVSGYVVEKNGSRKLAGAKVYLVEDHHSTYNVSQTYHDSTKSGSDGYYSFTFNHGDGDFRVIAEASNYYPIVFEVDRSKRGLLELGESQTYNVELWPYAWLKIRFLNQSGADGVTVNSLYGELYGYEIFNEVDVTVVGLGIGNQNNTIAYWVYPERIHRIDTVYPPGLDTTYHEIIY